jgi:hypothetical protein
MVTYRTISQYNELTTFNTGLTASAAGALQQQQRAPPAARPSPWRTRVRRGAGRGAARAARRLFDVKEDSATYPTLKVMQAWTGDILQVVDGLARVVVVKDGEMWVLARQTRCKNYMSFATRASKAMPS